MENGWVFEVFLFFFRKWYEDYRSEKSKYSTSLGDFLSSTCLNHDTLLIFFLSIPHVANALKRYFRCGRERTCQLLTVVR